MRHGVYTGVGNHMNLDKVIFNQEPSSIKRNFTFTIVASLIIGIPFLFIGTIQSSIIFIIFIVGMFAMPYLDKKYDGWKITEDTITILTNVYFKGLISKKIFLSEIDKIVYHSSQPKVPSHILIVTRGKKLKVLPKVDIFGLADTLKFLKLKGLLNGKIWSYDGIWLQVRDGEH